MCNFCDNLNYETKNKIIWNVRSTYADDNIYEFAEHENDYDFVDNQCWFDITGYKADGNTLVGIGYNQILSGEKIGEVNILPFSETIQFNYCPMCGKQISKDIKEFTGNWYGMYLQESE